MQHVIIEQLIVEISSDYLWIQGLMIYSYKDVTYYDLRARYVLNGNEVISTNRGVNNILHTEYSLDAALAAFFYY